jgi:proline dehydrogenase
MRSGFASRFIAGETLDDAIAAGQELARAGRRLIFNHLGENVHTEAEANRARDTYVEILETLERVGLDGSIAIKLTQLGLDLSHDFCRTLSADIAAAAGRLGRTIEIDMEGSAYTQATIEIFEAVQSQHGNVGLAIQTYLRRSEADLARLAPLSPRVRVVKGAYREPPRIAFQTKAAVDASYCTLLDILLRACASSRGFAAVATHDPLLIEYARARIAELGVSAAHYEFQMLYGIRRDLQRELVAAGHPLRVYLPFGAAWWPYFMRRLAERPANLWFVLRSLAAERKAPEPSER